MEGGDALYHYGNSKFFVRHDVYGMYEIECVSVSRGGRNPTDQVPAMCKL